MAAAMTMKKIGLGVFLIFCYMCVSLFADILSLEWKVVILRIRSLVRDQILLSYGGLLIWTSLTVALDERSSIVQDSENLRRSSLHRQKKSNVKFNIRTSLLIKILFLVVVAFGHSTLLIYYKARGPNPHWFSIVAYVCFGFYLQFSLCIGFINIIACVVPFTHLHKLVPTSGKSAQRTKLLASLIYALTIVVCGLSRTFSLPNINDIHISMQKLPKSMDNFVITMISDIHLGPTVGKERFANVVDMINSEPTDLVVLVGDLMDSTVDRMSSSIEPAKDIKAKYGKYYVTGNHEYYTGDLSNWIPVIEDTGFKFLHNINVKIHDATHPEDFFYLAGVDDIQANKVKYADHGMDINKALSGCLEGHAIVLLAHQPVAGKEALDSHHEIQLVLSGHTHGGQFFPFTILAYLYNPFYAGLYTYNDAHIYVSQGTLFWGIPLRVGTTMEVTRIILHAE